MNKPQFENILRNSPETSGTVPERLHQDVMRKIRLSQPVGKKANMRWSVPAWGAALAVGAIAIFSATQINTPQDPVQIDTRFVQKPASLLSLSDQLMTISEESLLPEKQLRLELERLKLDLKRFDFRS